MYIYLYSPPKINFKMAAHSTLTYRLILDTKQKSKVLQMVYNVCKDCNLLLMFKMCDYNKHWFVMYHFKYNSFFFLLLYTRWVVNAGPMHRNRTRRTPRSTTLCVLMWMWRVDHATRLHGNMATHIDRLYLFSLVNAFQLHGKTITYT